MKQDIRVKLYPLIKGAVEDGALCGLRRGYKYTDTPTEEELAAAIAEAVMLNISEIIDWGAR